MMQNEFSKGMTRGMCAQRNPIHIADASLKPFEIVNSTKPPTGPGELSPKNRKV